MKNNFKFFLGAFILAIVASLVGAVIISLTAINKEEYLDSLYSIDSYAGIHEEKYEDETYTRDIYYTRDQGLMIYLYDEIDEFQFQSQNFYVDSKGKWNLILDDNDTVPGSPEFITGLVRADYDLGEFKKIENEENCEQLGIKDNCIAFRYQNDKAIEYYFQQDSKEIKAITIIESDRESNTYYFTSINDDRISVNGKFQEMQDQIKADVDETLEK